MYNIIIMEKTIIHRSMFVALGIVSMFSFFCSSPNDRGEPVRSLQNRNGESHRAINEDSIDIHALNAPPDAEGHLDDLVIYLTEPFKNDRDKVRVIFRWTADRIAYDWKSYLSGKSKASDANSVLKTRLSVCEGYANLFTAMADKAGIESVVVSGFSKGLGYSPNQKFKVPDHAWNAVKLDGEWHLLDVTWASGVIENNSFKKVYNEYYYLTPPEQFINDHLPADKKWQLLSRPISVNDFKSAVKKHSAFYELGISELSPNSDTLKANDYLEIEIVGPPGLNFLADLNKSHDYTFVESLGTSHKILVLSPGRGKYELNIYAKHSSEQESYPAILSYTIHFQKGNVRNQFVKVYSGNFYLFSPKQRFLSEDYTYDFQIEVPHALEVAFIDSYGKWKRYSRGSNDTFYIRDSFPRGKLTINAKYGEGSWPTLVEYIVE
ncbi:hypothetical protein EHQ58_10250 [Leptospira ognonensis]|uniref:Transglutaminase-like domain-containing protein n=2 Tax=Leptospira ognonensis TaxID=2484945 RepID=A0A4R9JZ78_9LEPT|nr:hypothetical protein EHQ58_10250 [Leptospira ognonensis]